MPDTLYINSDNLVSVTGLYDNASDAYVNTASISAQLTDSANAAVGGAFTLSYVDGSDGNYEGTLPDETADDMAQDCYYNLTLTITNGSSKLVIVRQAVARYDNAN